MHHVSLYAPVGEVNEFIRELQVKGLCQIGETGEWKCEGHEKHEEAEALHREIKEIRESLEAYRPTVRSIRRILFPKGTQKVTVDRTDITEIVKDAKRRLDAVKPRLETNVEELKSKKQELIQEISDLRKFPAEMDLSLFKDNWTVESFAGLIRVKNEKDAEKLPGVKVFNPLDKKTKFLAIFVKKEDAEEALQKLHKMGFERLELKDYEETPNERIRKLNTQLGKVREDISKERKRLADLWETEYLTLDAIVEDLDIILDRCKAYGAVGHGYSMAKLETWVPEKNWEKFHSLAKRKFSAYHIEAEEREDAPTLLENPQPVKAFEQITTLYGLPKYGKVDPTPLLAISFALFFGFMLTDAVYGVVLSLIGLLLVVGIGKHDESAKNFGTIVVVSGLFTAVLGAVFGSWMGSLLTEMFNIPFWIDPMKEATTVLVISLAIGLLHIMTGYIIGIINALKSKDFVGAARPGGVMLLFLGGLLIFIGSMFLGAWLQTVALACIGLSVVGNFIFAFKQNGGIMSALSIFDYTGFLGDWFSYARLMSLALGTAGIALAVNFMAGMVNDMIPIVGSVVAIILIVGGHGFNLGINALGSFVHSLRLHFLEFFSKFYDAGGVAYRPFYAQRKITEVR